MGASKAGDKVLIIGASGGIGTAFLQLGKLADLKMHGIASKSKHLILGEYGAIPIDCHTQDFVEVIRRPEPALGQVLLLHLLPNGRSAKYYSTGVSRFN